MDLLFSAIENKVCGLMNLLYDGVVVRRGQGIIKLAIGIVKVILVISICAQVLLVLATTIGRYGFHYAPPAWEEVAEYLFLWNVMLGTGLTIDDDSMPTVRILSDRAKNYGISISVFRYLIMTTVFIGVSMGGFQLISQSTGISTPDLPISQAIPYSVVAIGGVFAALLCIKKLLGEILRCRAWNIVVAAFVPFIIVLAVYVVIGRSNLTGDGIGVVYSLLVVLILAILASVPVGVALTASALCAADWSHTTPIVAVATNLAASLNSFVLLAIPFFLLTGIILSRSSLSSRLLGISKAIFGGHRGAIGTSDVVASVLFADMSGSAIADTAALGAVVIPELKAAGYPAERAVALQASAGALGIMFPPSVTMIIYASVANISVIAAFLSVVLPGIVLAVGYGVMTYVYARRHGVDTGTRVPRRDRLKLTINALPVFVIPLVLLGGILSGLASPAEAGTLAVVVALVLSVIGYRDIRIKQLPSVIIESARIVARVGFIIASATVVAFVATSFEGPQELLSLLHPLGSQVILVLVIFAGMLLIIHTMMDATATMLVVTPLLEPILGVLHVSLIRFGVIIDVTSAAGLIIPPIGFNLYIACQTGNVSLERATRAVLPFVGMTMVVTVVIILVPALSTFLPNLVH